MRFVKVTRCAERDDNKAAAARDAILKPVLKGLIGRSTRVIAAELTDRGIASPGAARLEPMTVLRVIRRLGLTD